MADRPLSRRIVKPLFRLLRGGSRAHLEESWPHLGLSRPDGDRAGEIRWKGRALASLRPFADFVRLAGDEILIVGSGPSVSGLDLARMPGDRAMLLNGALALVPDLGPPLAAVIEDERFVWRHFAMMRQAIAPATPCLFAPSVLRAIASLDPDWLSGRTVFLVDDLLKPFDGPRRPVEAVAGLVTRTQDAALSREPQRGIIKAGTVAYTALQFALASGTARIGLAGIDLANAAQPRFYEKSGQAAWSGLDKGLARMLAHFDLALAEARACGIATECHSPVSALIARGWTYSDRLAVPPQAGTKA